MSAGKTKEFIKPDGVSQIGSIFLAIARTVLIIYLLRADPLSSAFRYLLIILFFVSVARHLLFYFSEPIPDNIYNFFLDLLTPCLYGFLLFHILSIYQADFLSLAVSFFLSAIIYYFLFAREPNQGMNKITFFGGMFCYVLSFLLALNYSFDFSNPAVEKYFLANKYSVTVGSDYDGAQGDYYYFDLIHVDSIATPVHWVEVNQKTCNHYHNSWKYRMIELENETFMILDRKIHSTFKHQCSFLLQKTNGSIQKRLITEQQYSRFEEGDTFNIEKHKGLWGIEWLTYR